LLVVHVALLLPITLFSARAADESRAAPPGISMLKVSVFAAAP
jgi:hypothetical protein